MVIMDAAVKATVSVAVCERHESLVTVETERAVWASAAIFFPVHMIVVRTKHKFTHQLLKRQLSTAFLG
jgi:hypothetical protein